MAAFLYLLLCSSVAMAATFPNPMLTPGVADIDVSTTSLCTPGYTKTVRNVTEEEKKEVCENYVDLCKPHTVEIDHLISLELGGTNDGENLWPQDYCSKATAGKTCFGAREKDVVETELHHWICKGEITVQEAQAIITSDWLQCYRQIKKGNICRRFSQTKTWRP